MLKLVSVLRLLDLLKQGNHVNIGKVFNLTVDRICAEYSDYCEMK
jgi:hypothetical protein